LLLVLDMAVDIARRLAVLILRSEEMEGMVKVGPELLHIRFRHPDMQPERTFMTHISKGLEQARAMLSRTDRFRLVF
jgi:hypothetical protein